MRFFIRLILIVAFTLVGQLALGWSWAIVAVAGLLGGVLVPGKGFSSFASGFLAVGLVWTIWAYQIDSEAESILSAQVSGIFMLPGKPWAMLLITGFIGGLVAGFGALSGWSLRKLRAKNKPRRGGYYRG